MPIVQSISDAAARGYGHLNNLDLNNIPVKSGLILQLDSNLYSSYSGVGSTWYDVSGNGNHFTMRGSLTWNKTTGFTGFTSNNHFYRNSWPTNLKTSQGGSGLTTIAWAKNSGANGVWQKLMGNGDEQGYIDLYLVPNTTTWHSEDGSSLFYDNNNSVSQDTFNVGTNTWRMLGTTNSNGGTTTNPTDAFGIGAEGDQAYNYPWNGPIAVVLIYNRVLSGSEISQLWNYYKTRFGV